MTGTALTEATEFMKIYKLGVVADPDEPADGPRRPERSGLQDQGRQVARGRRARSSERHERGQPVLVGTISVEVSELLGEQLRQARHHAHRPQRQARVRRARGRDRRRGGPARRGHDRDEHGRPRRRHQARRQRRAPHRSSSSRKLGLQPGDPDYDERFADVLPKIEERVEEDRDEGHGGRRPVHRRHRAPRVAAHRQPAPRPLRPPGRPGRVALLPLRRGRPRAPVRRRPDLQDPRPPRRRPTRRATRSRSRPGCSPSRSRRPSGRSRSRTSSSASASSSTTTS